MDRLRWQKQGDEWSVEGGTTEILWGTIRPRINAFVPMDTILEIAPGVGGCTQYRSLQRGSVGRGIGCILIRVCPAFWRTMKGMLPQGRFSVTGREVFGRTWNRERRDLVGY